MLCMTTVCNEAAVTGEVKVWMSERMGRHNFRDISRQGNTGPYRLQVEI